MSKGVVEAIEKEDFVKWFSELSNKDIKIAGGKGASLAEMYNSKFPIPPGFIVTAQAYKYFIEKAGLVEKIKELFSGVDVEDTELLEKDAAEMRNLISSAEMPEDLEKEIAESYETLNADKDDFVARGRAMDILRTSKEPPFVAVRSSATAEDLVDASFAGQQESFLNVKGRASLIQKIKECFASLFTARAVYYRTKKGFSHETTYLAVVVQKMVDSEKSGVMFSKNPIKDDDTIMIEAVFGLGEGIVSGMIKPDSYIVSRNLDDFKILDTQISEKKVAIARTSSGKNEIIKLTKEKAMKQVLTNYEVKILSQYAEKLEKHYKKPQDIEFAIEGGDVYIVQSRPITTLSKIQSYGKDDRAKGNLLLSGLGASPGVASGVVKIIKDLKDLDKIKKGDVLVTIMTNPDMVITMQKSAAIVTDEGGVTSHAAIVSREMGIPAVVGTGEATSKLKDGMIISVDGTSGKVFEGAVEGHLAEVNPIVQTKTKIKVVVDLPDYAERAAKSKVKAIGLTRIEGIIAGSGKHPLFYSKHKKIEDYVKVLHSGLRKISLPFEEMWIRTSDIRSDEFRNLEGAPKNVEGNPMLGEHGIRFSIKHKDILEAELEAIKKIALEFPDKKIGVMMPQIISVEEVNATKELLEKTACPKNLVLGIMVETPAAVQIINDLCQTGIKFISFGTNDLTQYTLAIDRNNTEVQDLYNEMNPAVLNSIRYVIRRCKKYGVETSICGQAGSREDMVRFLVNEGIDSISVNADAAEKVSKTIAEVEKSLLSDKKRDLPIETDEGDGMGGNGNAGMSNNSGENISLSGQEVSNAFTGPRLKQDEFFNKDIEEAILEEWDSDSKVKAIQNKNFEKIFDDKADSAAVAAVISFNEDMKLLASAGLGGNAGAEDKIGKAGGGEDNDLGDGKEDEKPGFEEPEDVKMPREGNLREIEKLDSKKEWIFDTRKKKAADIIEEAVEERGEEKGEREGNAKEILDETSEIF